MSYRKIKSVRNLITLSVSKEQAATPVPYPLPPAPPIPPPSAPPGPQVKFADWVGRVALMKVNLCGDLLDSHLSFLSARGSQIVFQTNDGFVGAAPKHYFAE